MAKRKLKKKSNKRLDRSYKNYRKRYFKAKRRLKKKGKSMVSDIMTKKEYERAKKLLQDSNVKTNINQKLVSEQTYEYDKATAQRFKKTAEELDLDWEDSSIFDLMKGKVDVSAINNRLKEEYPEMTGTERAAYITEEVFGGSP